MRTFVAGSTSVAAFFLFFFFLSRIESATPTRLTDGKPEFAVATVNGMVCWTQKDRDDAVAGVRATTGTLDVTNYTPSQFEVSVTTAGLKFSNYTDLERTLTEKKYLEDKLDDLPPSKQKENKTTLDFLRMAK